MEKGGLFGRPLVVGLEKFTNPPPPPPPRLIFSLRGLNTSKTRGDVAAARWPRRKNLSWNVLSITFSGWTTQCLRVAVVREVNAFGAPFKSTGSRVLSVSQVCRGVNTTSFRIYHSSGTPCAGVGLRIAHS